MEEKDYFLKPVVFCFCLRILPFRMVGGLGLDFLAQGWDFMCCCWCHTVEGCGLKAQLQTKGSETPKP